MTSLESALRELKLSRDTGEIESVAAGEAVLNQSVAAFLSFAAGANVEGLQRLASVIFDAVRAPAAGSDARTITYALVFIGELSRRLFELSSPNFEAARLLSKEPIKLIVRALAERDNMQASQLREISGIPHQSNLARYMRELARANIVGSQRAPDNSAWYHLTINGRRLVRERGIHIFDTETLAASTISPTLSAAVSMPARPSKGKRSALVAHVDPAVASRLTRLFSQAGCDTTNTADPIDVLREFGTRRFEFIVADEAATDIAALAKYILTVEPSLAQRTLLITKATVELGKAGFATIAPDSASLARAVEIVETWLSSSEIGPAWATYANKKAFCITGGSLSDHLREWDIKTQMVLTEFLVRVNCHVEQKWKFASDSIEELMRSENCIFVGGPKMNRGTDTALRHFFGAPNAESRLLFVGPSQARGAEGVAAVKGTVKGYKGSGLFVSPRSEGSSPLFVPVTRFRQFRRSEGHGRDVGLVVYCRRPLGTTNDVTTIIIAGYSGLATLETARGLIGGGGIRLDDIPDSGVPVAKFMQFEYEKLANSDERIVLESSRRWLTVDEKADDLEEDLSESAVEDVDIFEGAGAD